MTGKKKNLKNGYVNVVFSVTCNFLNMTRVKGDKETVTIAHAKSLLIKQLIEEY